MSLTQVRYRCAVRHRYGITQLRSCAVVVMWLCSGPVKLVSAHVSWLCRTCVSDIRSYDHMNNIAWYMLWYSHYDMYVLHDVCDDCLNLITRWVQFKVLPAFSGKSWKSELFPIWWLWKNLSGFRLGKPRIFIWISKSRFSRTEFRAKSRHGTIHLLENFFGESETFSFR